MLFRRKNKTDVFSSSDVDGITSGVSQPPKMEKFSSPKSDVFNFKTAFKVFSLIAVLFFIGCCIAYAIFFSLQRKNNRYVTGFSRVGEGNAYVTTALTVEGTQDSTAEEQESTAEQEDIMLEQIVYNEIEDTVEAQETEEAAVSDAAGAAVSTNPSETQMTDNSIENEEELIDEDNAGDDDSNMVNAKRVENAINSERSDAGTDELDTDPDLSKEAQYHSDAFARDRSIYAIDGYDISLTGKVNDTNAISGKRLNNMLRENGYSENDSRKVGIGVSESDNGGYYYAILVK